MRHQMHEWCEREQYRAENAMERAELERSRNHIHACTDVILFVAGLICGWCAAVTTWSVCR